MLAIKVFDLRGLVALEVEVDRQTSPFARAKTKKTLSPSTFFEVTSEATQPSVASGCQAFVPTS
jgi:hypothetical protein